MSKLLVGLALTLLAAGVLACASGDESVPASTPEPTPDIDATVAAQVQATLAAVSPAPAVAPIPTPIPTLPPLVDAKPTTTPIPRRIHQPTAEPTAVSVEKPSRLEQVRARGHLICAVNMGLPGFGFVDAAGNNRGFYVDLCRAVAVAVLGDADAARYIPITAAERGPTLQSGEVDMISQNTTWTSSRDAEWGNFAQTMFYDGQGFMVPAAAGIFSLAELKGATVCVWLATTSAVNVRDFNYRSGLNLDVVATHNPLELYLSEHCDAFTGDRSALASIRFGFANPDEHIILRGTISEEPLGPAVPHGDEQWFDIVKTVMAILIYAEAYGIAADTVPAAGAGDYAVNRLLGTEGSFGQEALGLSLTVAQDVIRAVGNYGEIYDRYLTPLGLARAGSRNALWSAAPCADCPKGGQIYAAPLQ